MSASKKKKLRREENHDEKLLKQEQLQAQQKSDKKYKIGTAVVAVCLAVLVFLAVAFTATFPITTLTAATVGDHNLTPAELAYYYKDAYYNYYYQYEDFISYLLDTNSPLDAQIYDEETGETWADFFLEQGLASAASTYELYDAAMADGFTLSEEDNAYLEELSTNFEYAGTMYGLDDADAYIVQTYGKGTSLEGYMEYATIGRIASSYSASIGSSFSFTEEDRAAEIEANPNNYQTVDYKVYYVSVVTGTNEDGTDIVDMEATAKAAEDMATASYQNMEEFDRLSVELTAEDKQETYADGSYTYRLGGTISSATEPLQEWLADASRQEGDTTFVEANENAYYVGYYIGRGDMTITLPNVRMISVPAVANAENEEDPTGILAAKASAEEILASYESGSTDFSDLDSNVLLENYVPGAISNLDVNWLFDTSRETGDTTVLSNDAAAYVFYYEGQGLDYENGLAETSLRNTAYSTWVTEHSTNYESNTNWLGMGFVQK